MSKILAHGEGQHSSDYAGEYGAHGHKDHGHFIVPLPTLRAVLLALLFFTLLTVGLSKGEAIIAETFNFVIPQWVNVVVAMSIACVKTAIVVMFFMQLKYDNPLNAMIFIFTLMTVCFFLAFTMIDLGNRGTLDRLRARYQVPGGTGLSGAGPITAVAREEAILEGRYHPHHDHAENELSIAGLTDAGYRDNLPSRGSSEELSRPVRGLTLPGFAPVGADDHGDGHEHEDGVSTPHGPSDTEAHGSESATPEKPADVPGKPGQH